MNLLTGSWREWEVSLDRASVTIGVLDGVHRGHRALISALDSSLTPTVLTFDPHPVEILGPGTNPRLITDVNERVARLERLGVRRVGVLDLAEIKDLDPRDFVEKVLVEVVGVGQLALGEDFRFGRDRAGDVPLLRRMGEVYGFEVTVVDLIGDGEGVISSSRIRALIESGRLKEAELAMGARFQLTNLVVSGDSRGQTIGFPTANLIPPPRKVVPADGVYAAFARIGEEVHRAAVSVGVRPTFGGGDRLVEAYLLDFDGDIYGEEMTVEFVEYLRPELNFENVEELIDQMKLDVIETRHTLQGVSTNMG